MNPAIFIHHGSLPEDRYLLGHFKWAYNIYLGAALVECNPPLDEPMDVTLELGGTLTGVTFRIEAGTFAALKTIPVNLYLTAGNSMRWKVTGYEGDLADAGSRIGITVTLKGFEGDIPAANMTIRWAEVIGGAPAPYRGSGPRRVFTTLFNYDVETKTFTESSPGIADGKLEIITVGGAPPAQTSISFRVLGTECLRIASDILYANSFYAVKRGTITDLTCAEFCIDEVPIARLTELNFRVMDLLEQDPPILTDNVFEFYSNSSLTGFLARNMLTAKTFVEL